MSPLKLALSLYLTAVSASVAAAGDPLKPAVIQWGASAAEIEAALEGKCAGGFVNRPIEPPFLPNVQTAQVQIDCDGLLFMSVPRWAEFVIGDDRLQMVWILVDAEDQDHIVAAMTAAYGAPSGENADFIAFAQNRAAWRFRPPEVLFYAVEIDDWVGRWLKVAE